MPAFRGDSGALPAAAGVCVGRMPNHVCGVAAIEHVIVEYMQYKGLFRPFGACV